MFCDQRNTILLRAPSSTMFIVYAVQCCQRKEDKKKEEGKRGFFK
jgi:hypothetical protein